jgi:hypothetical protein
MVGKRADSGDERYRRRVLLSGGDVTADDVFFSAEES